MSCPVGGGTPPVITQVLATFAALQGFANLSTANVVTFANEYQGLLGDLEPPTVSGNIPNTADPEYQDIPFGEAPYGEPSDLDTTELPDVYTPTFTDFGDTTPETIPDYDAHSTSELTFPEPPSTEVGSLSVATPDRLTLDTSGLPDPLSLEFPETPSHSISELDFSGLPTPLTVEVPDPPSHSTSELDFSGLPSLGTINVPTDFPELDEVSLPDAPSLTIPTAPTLENIPIPEMLPLSLPVFSGVAPDTTIQLPDIITPDPEAAYSSSTLTALRNQILTVLQGNRGYLDDIWDAIWIRERGNEADAALEAQEAVMELWAARGWAAPGGVEAEQLLKITKTLFDNSAKRAREIAIEQNKQEVERFNFHVAQGIALENILVSLFNQASARALQRVELINNAAIAFLQANVAKINLELEAYKTKAAVHRDLLQAELAKVQIFEAELRGAALQGEVEQRKLNLYLGLLDAITKQIQIYVAEVDGEKAKIEINRARVGLFAERINAVKVQLEAEKIKFDAYDSKVKSQLGIVQAWEIEGRAFASVIEGIKTVVEAKKLEYDGYDTKVKGELGKTAAWDVEARLYAAALSGVDTRVRAKALEYTGFDSKLKGQGILIDNLRAETSLFDSEVRGKGLLLDKKKLDVEIFDAGIRRELGKIQAWGAEAQSYTAQVGGISASNSNLIEGAKLIVSENDFELRKQQASLEYFSKMLQKEIEVFKANIEVDNSNRALYATELGKIVEGNQQRTAKYSAEISKNAAIGQQALSTAQINAAYALRTTELELKAVEAIMHTYASLASASMAAMNVGAHLQGSTSDSNNYSYECD